MPNAPPMLIGGCKKIKKEKNMRFRHLPTNLLTQTELAEELAYYTKRLYRLQKLERMGKEVNPFLKEVFDREADLDMENRKRLLAR